MSNDETSIIHHFEVSVKCEMEGKNNLIKTHLNGIQVKDGL